MQLLQAKEMRAAREPTIRLIPPAWKPSFDGTEATQGPERVEEQITGVLRQIARSRASWTFSENDHLYLGDQVGSTEASEARLLKELGAENRG